MRGEACEVLTEREVAEWDRRVGRIRAWERWNEIDSCCREIIMGQIYYILRYTHHAKIAS